MKDMKKNKIEPLITNQNNTNTLALFNEYNEFVGVCFIMRTEEKTARFNVSLRGNLSNYEDHRQLFLDYAFKNLDIENISEGI